MADSLKVYLGRLRTLQRIRELSDGRLDLAQICVLGDQSSGKSSLLSACTGISFPESAGICTRAPIVVECCYEEKLSSDVYSIQVGGGDYEKCADLVELRQRISTSQIAALDALQQRAWESSNRGPEQGGAAPDTVCTSISKEEIRVKVSGPEQMNIIVVDLPGIIHNGPGVNETRDLIEKYCKPEQTLMLLVSEAKQDVEGIAAMELAQKHDPQGVRTLRVLTKFDMFDTDEARDRAVGWVREGQPRELGCHAVVCRNRVGLEPSPDEEEKCLHGLPSGRGGVAALKARLPSLFSRLIEKSMPGLHEQIRRKLLEAETSLQSVGHEPVEGVAMVHVFQQQAMSTGDFKKVLTPPMLRFQEAIHATGDRVTQEWTDEKFCPDAFSAPYFHGNDEAMKCMAEIASDWWREPTERFCQEVRKLTDVSLDGPKLPRDFLRAVEKEWAQVCDTEIYPEFWQAVQDARKQEEGFGTVNHYLDAKYKSLQVLPQRLREAIAEEIASMGDELSDEYDTNYSRIMSCLEQQADAWTASYEKQDLLEHQRLRIFDTVKALWAVEKKSFVDNIMKATRDHVVQRRETWLSLVVSNAEVLKSAKEDEGRAKERKRLRQTIESMRKCQRELQAM